MAKKLEINAALCKGCELCVEACPTDALELSREFNPAGYNYTVVDEEKCITCGSCYTVCPDCVYTIVEE